MGNRHLSGQGRSQDFSKGGAKIFSTPKAALFLRRVSRASPCFPIFSQFIIPCGTIQITDLLHLGPVTVGKKDSGKGGLARGPGGLMWRHQIQENRLGGTMLKKFWQAKILRQK